MNGTWNCAQTLLSSSPMDRITNAGISHVWAGSQRQTSFTTGNVTKWKFLCKQFSVPSKSEMLYTVFKDYILWPKRVPCIRMYTFLCDVKWRWVHTQAAWKAGNYLSVCVCVYVCVETNESLPEDLKVLLIPVLSSSDARKAFGVTAFKTVQTEKAHIYHLYLWDYCHLSPATRLWFQEQTAQSTAVHMLRWCPVKVSSQSSACLTSCVQIIWYFGGVLCPPQP